MIYEEDFELAAHLRRVAAEPQPAVPSGVYTYVERVAGGETADPAAKWPRKSRGVLRFHTRSRVAAAVGIAATLVLGLTATLLLTVGHWGSPVATPEYADLWSALEWHDITATAFTSTSTPEGLGSGLTAAIWRGVTYVDTGMSGTLWSSANGMNWRQVSGAPALNIVLATPDYMVGQSSVESPCVVPDQSGTPQPATCRASSAVWYSDDGSAWRRSSLQLPSGDSITSWAAVGSAVVVVASEMDYGYLDQSKVTDVAYVTTDGANWKAIQPPAETAGAVNCSVTATRAGFVFAGAVLDPSGPEVISGSNQLGSFSIHGYMKSWVSPDGATWSVYHPTYAAGQRSDLTGGLSQVLHGSLGDVVPMFANSLDGTNWSFGSEPLLSLGQASFSSNGSQVIISGDGPVFLVTLGDGRWQQLQSGGDVSSLPRQGQSLAIPGGVLYDAGGHVYFGRALTGIGIENPITPAPAPTPTPFASDAPPPRPPAVSMAPVRSWSGVSGLARVVNGPAGADLVVPWAHGFVAMKNASSGGLVQVWSSVDGKTWSVVHIDSLSGYMGQVVAVGDAVMLSTWDGGNGIWFSTDGVGWTRTTNGTPPIGDLPMAGDARGMIAAMDEPEGQAMYLASPTGTWYATHFRDAQIQTSKSVALSGTRWVVVGKMAGTGAGDWVPAAWSSSDAGTWTESLVSGAAGQGFVKIVAGRDGFVAVAKKTDQNGNTTGPAALWSSPDGETWSELATPLHPDATLNGDGSHIVACQVESGLPACWSSVDGQTWTSLNLGVDAPTLAALGSAGASLRGFPIGDGVLFTTPDGTWYGAAQTQH